MSFSLTLPEASVWSEAGKCSCPAPSATTTTACPCCSTFFFRHDRKTSMSKGTSGISVKSTSWLARVAWAAMNPLCRPISFTRPTPFSVENASTCAARIASAACVNAVWKPNERSIQGMSLSIVFGMPTTAIRSPRRSASSASFCAPRRLPSPPITNRMFTPCRASVSTATAGSWLPRDVPRIVPPRLLMSATACSVSCIGSEPSVRPLKPLRKPRTRRTP